MAGEPSNACSGFGSFMRAWVLAVLCFSYAGLPLSLCAADPQQTLATADRYADAGNWVKARDFYAQAEQEFRAQDDSRNELYAKFGRLHRDVEAGSYSRVAEEVEADLKKPVVQNDPDLKIRALSLKGTIDLNLNTTAAKDDYEQLMAIAKATGDAKWENRAAGELGIVAGLNGNVGAAGVALFGAISKAEALHDLAGQLSFSVWLANGMAVNGMADRALKILDKATEAANQSADAGIPVQLYIARIRALLNLPDGPQKEAGVAQAQRLIQDTLATARKDNTWGAQAELLNQAGLLAQSRNDLVSAAAYFSETADVADRADLPRMKASALYALCQVYKAQKQYSKAEHAIDAAILQQTKSQEPLDLPLYLAEKAEVEASLRHPARANALYTQATALVEAMLLNAPSPRVKSAMIDTMGKVYLGHFRLALSAFHSPAKAFEIVETARGRALADALMSDHRATGKPPAETSAEIEVTRLQSQLRRNSNTEAETKRLSAKLDQAYNALVPVEYAQDRAEVLQMSRPVALKTLQRSLLPGEVVIEYVLDNHKNSFAFEITPANVIVHDLPTQDLIDRLVHEYVKLIRAKQDSSQLASTVFRQIVAPALSGRPQSVTIIPDGSLHLLPFASLPDASGEYWIRSVKIASAPSATILQHLRSTRDTANPERPFLGIAFSPTSTDATTIQASRSRAASFGDHPIDLKPLPYAQQEVSAAAQVLGPGSVLLLNEKATETALKAQSLGSFQIIHVAAHGVNDVLEPDRTGLVLAPEDASEDGFWQAREIRRSHLAAELVTLSACETGVGRLQGEEGIMNLARSFLIAGAKSVVASLWDADDRSTATLMTHFYQHIAAGESVADSLQKAQLEILTEFGSDAKPYFWSGFTVIGDGTRKIIPKARAIDHGTARPDLR